MELKKLNNLESTNFYNSKLKSEKIKIIDAFNEMRFRSFLEYCNFCGMEYVKEITSVDIVAFKSKYNSNPELLNLIKERIKLLNGENSFENEKTQKLINNIEHEKSFFKKKCVNYPINKKKIDIRNLKMSVRTRNCLGRSNINTLDDLLKADDNYLIGIKNFGEKSFNEIKKIISSPLSHVINLKEIEELSKNDIELDNIEELRKSIENFLFSNDIEIATENYHEEEIEIINKVINAVSIANKDICASAYLKPTNSQYIISMCRVYFNNVEKTKIVLNLYEKIPMKRKKNKISPYVIAYSKIFKVEQSSFDFLIKFELIEEIEKEIFQILINENNNSLIQDFLSWLSFDLNAIFEKIEKSIFRNERSKEIIKSRANDETLEYIGKKCSLTRERVRQIEKNVQVLFDCNNNRNLKIHLLIFAENNREEILTVKDIKDTLNELSEMDKNTLIYLMKKSHTSYCFYNKDLSIFHFGKNNDFLNELTKLSELPNIMLIEKLDLEIKKIALETEISEKLIVILSEKMFKRTGEIAYKGRLTLSAMYEIILHKYYPYGLKVFDDNEIQRFKEKLIEFFGNEKLSITNRSLAIRITDLGLLCDRGTYIHEDYINVDEKIIDKIIKYINNSERDVISYLELFEYFKNDLMNNSNITNRYFLQGILRLKLKNKFYFNRDYISKQPNLNLSTEINEYIMKNEEVTKANLLIEFDGMSDAMLIQNILRCPQIILYGSSKFMHASKLNIEEKDSEIKNFIKLQINNEPTSASKLLEIMCLSHYEFLARNKINSPSKLFGILKYLFPNEFSFSRPFIACLGQKDLTNLSALKAQLKNVDKIEITEIVRICEKYHIKFPSLAIMIRLLQDDYIRVGSNLLVHVSKFILSDYSITQIRNNLFD
ncbi:MAG: DNA-directed RNA polymerase subunit alpha C-terminal domain-containing protein, partial [Clostridia bacterium]|nr:DNA-directed RNA polymerase subunit alpha C-terminal domain-containing protein [Clostridia bacterium]